MRVEMLCWYGGCGCHGCCCCWCILFLFSLASIRCDLSFFLSNWHNQWSSSTQSHSLHNTFHRSFDNFGWTIDFVLFIFFCKFCWTAGHVRKRSTAFIHHLIFFFRIEWTSFVFKNMAQNKKWFALYILSHSLWITHFVWFNVSRSITCEKQRANTSTTIIIAATAKAKANRLTIYLYIDSVSVIINAFQFHYSSEEEGEDKKDMRIDKKNYHSYSTHTDTHTQQFRFRLHTNTRTDRSSLVCLLIQYKQSAFNATNGEKESDEWEVSGKKIESNR